MLNPHCIMIEMLYGTLGVCEFELQLRYHVHFPTNTLVEVINPLTSPAMG